jgi:phosphoribosylformylglycinamidine cyclo-ligase
VYAGTKNLTDIEEETALTYGKLVLSPTRTFLPVLHRLIPNMKDKIHGLIHTTGGAQTKVMNFVNGMHVIKDNMFDVPPLFRIIQEESETDWREMYQVFNMGHRLEVYLKPELAQEVIDMSAEFGIEARVIGRCESAKENKLTISTDTGTYTY